MNVKAIHDVVLEGERVYECATYKTSIVMSVESDGDKLDFVQLADES